MAAIQIFDNPKPKTLAQGFLVVPEYRHIVSRGEKMGSVAVNLIEVESDIPGGGRMAASGTSMSAPQVVNLAAKIIAVEPFMTPQAVIDLIIKGATPRDGDENFLLLHPKDTMNLLKTAQEKDTVRRELKPDPARMVVE